MSPSVSVRARWHSVARAVGWVTFLEIVRDKVLYNIVVFALLLFGLGFLGSTMTYNAPQRIVMDFGISSVMLSSAMIAILTGAGLLGREFERRTIYVALSRPITRAQFVFGKFLGLAGVLSVNWLLLTAVFSWILVTVGNGFEDLLHPTLFAGLCLILLQSFVLASMAIFFASFSTASLAVTFTFGLFLIGNNISELRALAVKSGLGGVQWGLNFLAATLPNFEHFNLGTKISYGLPVSWQFLAGSSGYAVLLIALFLSLAGVLIRAREV